MLQTSVFPQLLPEEAANLVVRQGVPQKAMNKLSPTALSKGKGARGTLPLPLRSSPTHFGDV